MFARGEEDSPPQATVSEASLHQGNSVLRMAARPPGLSSDSTHHRTLGFALRTFSAFATHRYSLRGAPLRQWDDAQREAEIHKVSRSRRSDVTLRPVELLIVHNHFRPGGLRRVIELPTPHSVAHWPERVQGLVLATGDAPEPAWLRAFRKQLHDTPVKVVVQPAMRSSSRQMMTSMLFIAAGVPADGTIQSTSGIVRRCADSASSF